MWDSTWARLGAEIVAEEESKERPRAKFRHLNITPRTWRGNRTHLLSHSQIHTLQRNRYAVSLGELQVMCQFLPR